MPTGHPNRRGNSRTGGVKHLAALALLLGGTGCGPASPGSGSTAAGVTYSPDEPPEGMVFVPAGEYSVGSGSPEEGPVQTVELGGFFIDRLPVTEAQLVGFHTQGAPEGMFEGRRMGVSPEKDLVLPATAATYVEAEAYAASLGRRLPTAAEWEAAARGVEGLRYPWGDSWDPTRVDAAAKGWTDVGQHTQGASPFGVEDMVGNVFHWTATQVRGRASDAPEREAAILQVVKAGSWPRMEKYNRTTFRTALKRDLRSSFLGFRTVLPLDRGDPNLAAAAAEVQFDDQTFGASEALRQLLSFELLPNRDVPPLMERHMAELPAGATIADIGAGIGYLSYRLADRVGPTGKVYAVDIDRSVLEFVDAYTAQEGIEVIETVLSEDTDVKLPPGSCDAIYLLGTLHCLTEGSWRFFIHSCRASLKPGGVLVIKDSNNYDVVAQSALRMQEQGFLLVEAEGDTGPWTGTGQGTADRGATNQGTGDVVVILRRTD